MLLKLGVFLVVVGLVKLLIAFVLRAKQKTTAPIFAVDKEDTKE